MPSFSIDIDYIGRATYYQSPERRINSILITLNVKQYIHYRMILTFRLILLENLLI